MRYIKIGIISLAILFTAQACNFLFGDLYGGEGSGPRGMYMSVDSGESWAQINNSSDEERQMVNARVSDVFIESSFPNNILVSTSNAGVFASDNGGEQWFSLLPDVIAYSVFINPTNREEIYASGADPSRLATVWKSPDRGGVWRAIFNEPSGQASISSMTFDPRQPNVFYAGLSTGALIKTVDFGETWNALHKIDSRIVKIVVAPEGGGAIYAVGSTKGILRSRDQGASWDELSLFQLGFGASQPTYNDVFVDPGNPRIIYAATSQGLFVSRNSGDTWQVLNLPAGQDAVNVDAVSINHDNRAQIFAAVRWTIYKSDDAGITWKTIQLPTRRVISDIVIDPSEPNRIYAGVK